MRINGTPENDNLNGTAENDTLTGLNGDDRLNGRAGDDLLEGGIGDDILIGAEGNDTLRGGVGDNVLNGGLGNDVIFFDIGQQTVNGGDGNDSLILNFASQTEDLIFTYNVFAEPSPTEGGVLDGTSVQGIEQVDFTAGSGNDLIDIATASLGSNLAGGAGNDSLIGGLGNDILEGDAGDDTFFGANGNDEIFGGEGNDAAVFLGPASNYEVTLGETLTAVTGAAPIEPIGEEDGEDGEEEIPIVEPESFSDILSEVEIILFENGEIIVETGEFIPFDADSPDSELVPTINEGSDEDITDLIDEDDGIPVFRFFRNDTQTQFYTTEEIERDTILETLPQYELEGISFIGAPTEEEGDPLTGTSPVYRFFNRDTGIHLYTVDENERDFVAENLDNYVLEGTPYYGYDTQVEGTVPLYRFYNQGLDAHFYTPNAEERDFFLESPDYQPEGGGEGIAFYVEPAPEL